jgi:hypothetical protein
LSLHHRNTPVCKHGPSSHKNSTFNGHRQHPQPPPQKTPIAGHEMYETLKFDHTGQYVITLSQKWKQPTERFITVFDLLSPVTSPNQTIPIHPSPKTHYSYNVERHSIPTDVIPPSILFLTGHHPKEQKIWVSTERYDTLVSYPMLQDKNVDHDLDDDDNDDVVDTLMGHMGRIRCSAVLTGPNRIRQRHPSRHSTRNTYAPYTIITAADDGVILVWEQQASPVNKTTMNDDDDNDDPNHNKRQRLSMNQQQQHPSSITGDYDNW